MRTLRVVLLVLIAALVFGQQTSAQSLPYLLFERYLETLRQQNAIPGLSAAILQNETIVWEAGLGQASIEGNIAPTGTTPYVIGDLSQVFASAVLLEKCVDQSFLRTSDRVVRWDPTFANDGSSVANLLTHTTAAGIFHYDLSRYAVLTNVIDQCAGSSPYRKQLADEIFARFAMTDSVPGQALAVPTLDDQRLFDPATLGRYATTISRLAVPYRVDGRGHATRSDFAGQPLTASGGVITTVYDLSLFDKALSQGYLLHPETLQAAWTRATVNGVAVPTGLGWFVQNYNGEQLVWQFGTIKDAYSALLLKLPKRNVTLILLANSDGLNSPYALENGDITTSAFAKIFFRIFGL